MNILNLLAIYVQVWSIYSIWLNSAQNEKRQKALNSFEHRIHSSQRYFIRTWKITTTTTTITKEKWKRHRMLLLLVWCAIMHPAHFRKHIDTISLLQHKNAVIVMMTHDHRHCPNDKRTNKQMNERTNVYLSGMNKCTQALIPATIKYILFYSLFEHRNA